MLVIFLDIDGVMLPARAYALPENFRRQQLIGTPGYTGDLIDCLPVDFDPIAVALVNRMAELSGARIVLHSDWRRHYEKDVLRGHVIRQGLDEAHLHADWWIGAPFAQRKQETLVGWLRSHDLLAGLDEGDGGFVVIDDDPVFTPARNLACDETRRRLTLLERRHVRVDGEVGLALADYRHALKILGCSDPKLENLGLGR